jgi:hypothetical protein
MIEAIDQQRKAVARLYRSTGALRLAAFGSAVRSQDAFADNCVTLYPLQQRGPR